MILGEFYAKKAISQIPRILSMQDRNKYSPTFGCFDRIYWLDKSIDFPSSILQLNAHNLSLVYSCHYPENPFYRKDKIKNWSLAGVNYWIKIQHKDGSFDEFYPNERGWAGPTGFLLFSMLGTYSLLKDEIPQELREDLIEASYKSAKFLAKYDEIGILANHHAMALLPIYYAYKVLNDESLHRAFQEKFKYFESLQSSEGWFLEYDGADLGYLSATISFLGKIYKLSDDENLRAKILKIVKSAIEFSSYFVYPNGYYGGTMGSRQTLHFYPHGYEIFSQNFPLARKIADKMLDGLAEGKLVPPEIMPGRYLGYRVQEYLLTYLDYHPGAIGDDIRLPYERDGFIKHFEEAKICAVKKPAYYLTSNLAKGGVIKVFSPDGDLIYNDCGIIGELETGKVVTTQWINDSYNINFSDDEFVVEGEMHFAPFKLPTPIKMMAFRSGLLLLGWNTQLSYWMKGAIRSLFITRTKKSPVEFKRRIMLGEDKVIVEDKIKLKTSDKFRSLDIGDEFSVRFVPQSLYFQPQELQIGGFHPESDFIRQLNENKVATFKRIIDPSDKEIKFDAIAT
jgi:hypothetical protein